MFNLTWGILFVCLTFTLFLFCYRLFGKQGLYAWVAAAIVLANIQVLKTIQIFGFVMTLGNTMYASIYLATDLLNEKYGEKEAKKAVWIGFFFMTMATLIMQGVLGFRQQESDIAHEALQTIFGLAPRVSAGSLCAYFISQFLDVKIFSKLKVLYPLRSQLWIRNNGSTLVSQGIDTLIFCTVAFIGIYSWDVWWQLVLTTYILKFIISVIATPVIYWARGFSN